jgi:CRISPR type III-A-associated protein Csm2
MSERRYGNPPTQGSHENLDETQLRAILQGNAEVIVEKAQALAGELRRRDFPPTQLRNFYTPLVQLRESEDDPPEKLRKLHLQRPRLAYMNARTSGKADPLQKNFDWLIREVAKQKDQQQLKKQLDCLFEFAEAVVAYHKALS